MEPCSSSLDQLFLPDGEPKKFRWSSPVPDDRQVLLQIARGLHHVHSEGFVHRDVKPENILINQHADPDGLVKLSDFGLSKPVSVLETFTQSQIKGTPIYRPPEILELKRSPTGDLPSGSTKWDVFSAGCTFFNYVTQGMHPFGSGFDILPNIIEGNSINFRRGDVYLIF